MEHQSNSITNFAQSELSNRVYIDQPLAINNLKKIINRQLELNCNPQQQIIITCIGTDRSTGDALGPLVGTKLKKFHLNNIELIGTLNEPVHATNLQKKLSSVQKKYKNPFIIAVDAGLGKKDSVGAIDVQAKPLQPGSGVNKDLPQVGDLNITGLVNVAGHMEYLVLQSTRLHTVLRMARKITCALAQGIKKFSDL